jgi:hypothetical protein
MLAIEAFAALPRRGIEVGGVLLGEVHELEARIDGFEEAPCEHRYGPSYSLSPADKTKLGELLAEHTDPPPVIGFFRSFTSREPTIEEGDEELVREHFPKGDFVYLLLQPLSVENCVATFRFFRDGQMLPPSEEEQPFAFDLRQLPVMEPAVEVKLPGPQLVATPGPQLLPPPFRAFAEEPITRPIRTRSRWWIPAVVSLFIGVIGGLSYEMTTLPREEHWTELHLDARSQAGKLDISWDTGIPAVSKAIRGRLSVSDGGADRDIALDAAQVRAGKFSLPAAQPNVGLRLIVYAGDGTAVGDALRVAVLPSAIPSAIPMPEDRPAAAPAQPKAQAAPISVAARTPGVAVPPATLREVQPRIPDGIRSRIAAPIVIPVEVHVNEKGRVLRAVAEGNIGDGVQRYLATQAQKAAREWRFKPARNKSGGTIAASKTIQFVFNP